MAHYKEPTMEALQIPAMIAAVPAGAAFLMKAVLFGKELTKPSSNGNGNGAAAENRGWMRAVLENQSRILELHSKQHEQTLESIRDLALSIEKGFKR